MKALLKIAAIMLASYFLAAQTARAQNDIELSCRAKAKEVAVEAYTGCVSEGRKTRLNDIRSNYKAEVASVKAKYDQMLKEMAPPANGSATPAAKAPPVKKAKAATARAGRAEKPVSGIAKSLPAKQNDNGPALPLGYESEEQEAVMASDTGEISPEPEMVEVY